MHIQSYFKNGKPKKSVKTVKDEASLMKWLEDINDGKDYSLNIVKTVLKLKCLVYDDGTQRNLWDVMKEHGFDIELPF